MATQPDLTAEQSSSINPLDYQGPCKLCRHDNTGRPDICGPCLMPSPTGHNGKWRFEPVFEAPTIVRYWNDPAFKAELDAETQRNRDMANAAIDAGMAKARERMAMAAHPITDDERRAA